MEPVEALSAAAQVAATLAGFAGLVVVFRTGSVHEWSPIDKLRLRFLLANSIFPLAFCMFGLLLLSPKPELPAIWRWCSGFVLLFLIPLGSLSVKRSRSVPGEVLKPDMSRAVFSVFAGLGIAVTLLQVYNLAVLNAFWAFYAAVVFQLLGAVLQFARFILIPPRSA
jgi:hypothetical protein